jgi:hypothetical protein
MWCVSMFYCRETAVKTPYFTGCTLAGASSSARLLRARITSERRRHKFLAIVEVRTFKPTKSQILVSGLPKAILLESKFKS